MNDCQFCAEDIPLLLPQHRQAEMGSLPFCPNCEAGIVALQKYLFVILREYNFFTRRPSNKRIDFWFHPYGVGDDKSNVYKAISEFAEAGGMELFSALPHNSLYIHGYMGTGKTEALLSCAAQLVAFGYGNQIILINATELLHRLRSADQFDGSYQRLLRKFMMKPYLLIDDVVFTERRDDERIWTDLFAMRYNNKLPTVVTSMHAIESQPNITEFVKSRMLDQFVSVEMKGSVYRTTEEVRWDG